jgi:phosphonate transport system substrate-binding protein
MEIVSSAAASAASETVCAAPAQARRRALRCAAGLVGVLASALVVPARAQSPGVFTIGVLPNVSARLLFAAYQPMREYFERELGQKVEIATAPDFRSFSDRTFKGDYQMVVIAPNLGRVAQLDAGWEILGVYEPRIPALAVAAVENTDNSPTQLKGRALALANPQSLVALVGLDWVRQHGLVAGTDFRTILAANDDSLGTVLRSGEAPIAIMSRGELRAKPPEMQARLRVVHEIAQVPGFFVMAHPQTDPALRRRLRALLLGFPATDDGRRFIAMSGFSSIREVTEADLRFLDPYTDLTRRSLGLRP